MPPRSWFGIFTATLNIVGTVWIILITLLINADVIGLSLFDSPVPGVKEMTGLSIVGIVFLQLANTLREDRHVASDVLIKMLWRTRPRVAAFLNGVFHLIGGVLLSIIIYFAVPIFLQSYRGDFYVGAAGTFTFPTWPVYGLVLLGAATTAVQYILLFCEHIRAAATGRALRTRQHEMIS